MTGERELTGRALGGQTQSADGPLSGIRIAELSHWQAGPEAGTLLAYLGAEIVKIESRSHLDYYRRTGPDIEQSSDFQEFNQGKLSVRLNLKHPEGAGLAKRFILDLCDGFLFNLRRSSLEAVGLGPENLLELRPGLVIVALSLSGTTGPEANHVGYATNFVASGGLSYLTGYEDGPPAELIAWPDTAVGAWAAFAMVAGLLRQRRGGQGGFNDLSGRECVSALIGDALVAHTLYDAHPSRVGNKTPEAAPNNAYACAGQDEWIAISATNEAEWSGLLQAMGDPVWARGSKFSSEARRRKNQAEIDVHLTEWTKEHHARELTTVLQDLGVPAAPVLSSRELCGNEHIRERGAIVSVDRPISGVRTMVGAPWRFAKTPVNASRPAPWFGEHDAYVLQDLMGISDAEVDRLTRVGAVY